jgi:RNA polymerase sigma factor (sigma-70 family)
MKSKNDDYRNVMEWPRADSREVSVKTLVTNAESIAFDWLVVWLECEQRLRSWRVPPRWSACDWLDEMRAEGAAAALIAIRNYQPQYNVPIGVYVRMRIMGQVLTRYRKEWAYALRQVLTDWINDASEEVGTEQADLIMNDELQWVLAQLCETDRQFLERLYWSEETEAEIAKALGLSQQAINKRKHTILKTLRKKVPEGSKYI